MSYIDTHCHLNLIEENHTDLSSVLKEANDLQLESIIQIATDIESSKWGQNFSRKRIENGSSPRIFYTIGIHPEKAESESEDSKIEKFIFDSLNDDLFIAIGECGLDFFHSPEKQKVQEKTFEKHLELAEKTGLPLVLHLRDDRSYNPDKLQAMKRATEMVKSAGKIKGVLHCYTYSYDEALPYVDLGWKVSFSGIVTYKNAGVVKEAAANLPLSCIMAETDAPYLSPAPHRGKPNLPGYVSHTADFIAELRSETDKIPVNEIKNRILINSKEFIGWKHHA